MDKNEKEFRKMINKMNKEELLKLMVDKIGYEYSEETVTGERKLNYEEDKQNTYNEYLSGFNEELETNIKIRKQETPILRNLFTNFVSLMYKPSKMYQIAIDAKIKIKEELKDKLNKEQNILIEQLQFCEDRILDDMIEQAFIFGYSMATQMREEAIKQYPNKSEE